ncbi:succinate dehydrogenase/fumarate reductase iron-sulfur subunit [Azospirillum sp. ST 5-10]|uniref:succinate dehydrogenase/fumarate reductase iron-sulfur subunit n=1 Tax=unclassified Azospirillum TaxID=2630922 RepID=UPI003F4A5AF2
MPDASPTLPELTVAVWRGADDGALQEYRVPHHASQTVLDVVTWIQRHADPTLSYRFACRVGMCGSCAMTVNGTPRWTCRTHVARVQREGRLELRPLRNLPVLKDLATDMAPFFDKWRDGYGRFAPPPAPAEGFHRVDPDSPARRAASAGIECIGCAVCYAACDVVAWNPAYLGPAALNRAWTLVNDERDADRGGHLAAAAADAGCHACHSQGNCARHCPSGLNPSQAIAGLKRSVFTAYLRGEL